MPITLTIIADDENDYRRMLMRVATPYLEGFIEADGFAIEPEEIETPPAEAQAPPTAPEEVPPAAPKRGRPRKANGSEPQTEAQTQTPPPPTNGAGVELLSLTEQIQIITDAAHDQPDKFKPLLVPLRDKLGVQYVSKAVEKDRPVLQDFINEHGLAV